MKYFYLLISLIILLSCQNTDKDATTQIEATVLKEIDNLYEFYVKSDLQWVDYYQDDYTVISTDGAVESKSAKDLRVKWINIYNKYEVKLLDHGQPTILASKDQVVYYNTYKELFIKKETRDTIVSSGIWIVVWKKQENNT